MTGPREEDGELQPRLEGIDGAPPEAPDEAGRRSTTDPDDDLLDDDALDDARYDNPTPVRPTPPSAPVVTDEGVYGTLPDRRWVEREYAREERPWRDTLVRLLGILLALAAAVWIGVYSLYQATSETVARPALSIIAETIAGLPELLVLHEEAIRTTGEVPGYPLPVTVPTEARTSGVAQWREAILDQSSAILYEEGADAFHPTEGVATQGTFSTSGGTRLLINNLSASRNALASTLLWPAGIAALVLGLAVLAVGSRFGRFLALGIALAAASVPSIAGSALAYGIVTFAGSDGSLLAEAGHEIAWSITGIPLRNGLTFLAAGLGIAIAARVLAAVFEREREPEPVYD